MAKQDMGKAVREWLTEKLGNPVMTSKEKKVIKEIDETPEEYLHRKQETGEDYPAALHKR